MQGSPIIIAYLNRILRNELTAINQYFLHARILKNFGLPKLSSFEYKESIGEMKHADLIINRILFLEGLPNLQDLGKLLIGETVPEILSNDLFLEKTAHLELAEAASECEQNLDYVSCTLLQNILNETEEHISHLEIQIKLIEDLGLQNYLQNHSLANNT